MWEVPAKNRKNRLRTRKKRSEAAAPSPRKRLSRLRIFGPSMERQRPAYSGKKRPFSRDASPNRKKRKLRRKKGRGRGLLRV